MDTDPNSEVSALLDALGDSPELEATDNVGEAEGQEEHADASADEQQTDETVTDEDSGDGESLAVEFDGKTWEFPKGTPPEIVAKFKETADGLKADYTRKSQANADEAKRVKAQATQLQEVQQIASATFGKRLEVEKVSDQIRQIEAVNWDELSQVDPQRAIRLQAEYSRLQSVRNGMHQELNRLAGEEAQKIASEKQRLRNELRDQATTIIPGYNAQIDKELLDTVVECGFSQEDIADLTDPRLLKLINMARMGRQIQKSAPKALKKVAEAPKVITPKAQAPKRTNQSALDRLKSTGRAENLAAFL